VLLANNSSAAFERGFTSTGGTGALKFGPAAAVVAAVVVVAAPDCDWRLATIEASVVDPSAFIFSVMDATVLL